MSLPVLVVEAVARAFGGVVAVQDVSLAVAVGERLAIIGPNGAGKSTLFALIAGQERPDHGRVLLLGRDVTRLPAHRRVRAGLGRTFQTPRPFLTLGVHEAIRTAARLTLSRREADPRAEALVERLGLCGVRDVEGLQLTHADARKLDLALALAGKPRVLLLDEPVAGMAAAERAAMMALVSAVAREEGLAIIFTEHDMDVVFDVATRVVVLDRGAVLAQGEPQGVRADPAVQARYLGTGLRPV